MVKFLHSPNGQAVAQTVLWSAVLVLIVVLAYFVLVKLRDQSLNDREQPSDIMSNFREMHQKGEISDDEFRNIKTRLAAKLQQGLKDSGDKGSNEPK